MLARVREQLKAQQMLLEVTQEAKDHIIKLGYDPAYGARPLRRVIQNMIEDVLAEHLLLGRYEPGHDDRRRSRPGGRPGHPRRGSQDARRGALASPRAGILGERVPVGRGG